MSEFSKFHPDYAILSIYSGYNCKVLLKHKKEDCMEVFSRRADKLMDKPNKDICSNKHCSNFNKKKIALSQEEAESRINEKFNGEFIMVGKFNGVRHENEFLHNVKSCGIKTKEIYNRFLLKKYPCECQKSLKPTRGIPIDDLKNRVKTMTNGKYEIVDMDGFSTINESEVTIRHLEDCDQKDFRCRLGAFLYGQKRCPCMTKGGSSKGELIIKKWLDNKKYSYKKELTFDDLRSDSGYKLRYDFGIFNKDESMYCIIEFDGEQHYKPANFGSSAEKDEYTEEYYFKKTLRHDEIKDNYCYVNNIRLIRIPYWKFNEIDEILNKFVKPNGY